MEFNCSLQLCHNYAIPLLVVLCQAAIEGVVCAVFICHIAGGTEGVVVAEGTLPYDARDGGLLTPSALHSWVGGAWGGWWWWGGRDQ